MAITANNKAWSGRSLASGFFHRIFYVLIRVAGARAAYVLLMPVVLFYTLMPKVRMRSEPYLARRYPHQNFISRMVSHYRLNLEFGRVLVDRAALGILGEFKLNASDADKQTVQTLLTKGKGIIMLSAHVGGWQGGISGLDLFKCPVNILLHRPPGETDKHYFEHKKHSIPFRFIESSDSIGGVVECMAALKRCEVVCIMGDRSFGSSKGTVEVRFLSGAMEIPASPYRMALATGAAILIVFFRRTGPGLAEVRVVDWFEPADSSANDSDKLHEYAQRFANNLERFTSHYPYQFFNFHDLWKGD
jgi:predicted LPLAT superfamily acyltransferase